MIEPSLSMGIRRMRRLWGPIPLAYALFVVWGLGFGVGHWAQASQSGAKWVKLALLFVLGAVSGLALGAGTRRIRKSFSPSEHLTLGPPQKAGPGESYAAAETGIAPPDVLGPQAIELQAPSLGLAHKSPEATLRWENLAQASHALLGLLAQTLRDCRVALVRPQRTAAAVQLDCCAARPEAFAPQRWAEPLARAAEKEALSTTPLPLTLPEARALVMPVWPEEGPSEAGPAPWVGWVHLVVERDGPLGFAPGEAELVRTLGEQLTLSHRLEVALKSSQADLGRLAHLATTDGLTELSNRRHFEGVFALQLARATRYKRALSLLLLDIDHFKAVNDTFGHSVGDEVLQDVARVLMRTARCTDLVGRYGGEEFVVLMDETDLRGAARTAERVREALAKQPLGHTVQLRKTASIGVAAFPEHGARAAELIAAADAALYQAKRQGRDQIVLYQAHPAQTRRPG